MAEVSSICIYCGSRYGQRQVYRDTAVALGKEIARRGIRLIYGGGHVGLMGATADAVLAAGGEVIGVIPKHLQDWEVGHHGLTELHVVDTMHSRKQMMFELADAFVALPGGIGTLDETIEIISWRQLRLHDKPLVILDDGGYWQPLEALLKAVVVGGFADPRITDYYAVAANVDQVFDHLAAAPSSQGPGHPEIL
ncbi:MAG: TIGR00730 family Rossman fold protein [Proteobacteria bacterium]|nr:TIGR00730 family Rossman fold protein [Pseudomonadota bacterium]